MAPPLVRYDFIPLCPRCHKGEWLEFGIVFEVSTGKVIRHLWACSKAYEDWAGCGWKGEEPERVRAKAIGKEPKTGSIVPEFTEALRNLQSTADIIVVTHPDGEREVVS